MLQSVFIQNFRAWENQTFTFNGEHAVFVGGNDSGKSSVLQALDCFFNREAIDSAYVRDPRKDVSIGIRYNGVTYKKTFSAQTLRVKSRKPAALWHDIEAVHYIYLPANLKTTDTVLKELAEARADMLVPEELKKALAIVADRAIEQVLSGNNRVSQSRLENTHAEALQLGMDERFAMFVDYTIPSGKNRFFVYDYDLNRIVLQSRCAHG